MAPHLRIGRFLSFIAAVSLASSLLAANYSPAREEHLGDLDKPVQKKMDLMSKKLDLSPTQGFSVKAALEDEATKLDLLNKEYAEQKKKIADETDGLLMGILNPQQQETYQKIKPDIVGNAGNAPPEGPKFGPGRGGSLN